MNYGLYVSAGGALTSLYRQDVIANNLANVETVGYKADRVSVQARRPERLESPGIGADPRWMLERLGGGNIPGVTGVDLTQGGLRPTEGPLDLAIKGEGFLTVASNARPDDVHLTRDGRMSLDVGGRLVMADNGLNILGTNGRPIRLDRRSPVDIDGSGRITQNGSVVARIRVATTERPDRLRKAGANLLTTVDPLRPGSGSLRQGFVETSAVDPILTLNDMVNATKTAQANLKMMQYHDHVIGQSVNTFGRVA